VEVMDSVKEAVTKHEAGEIISEKIHLGRYKYVTVETPYKCVQIRKHFSKEGDVLPTITGISIKFGNEWEKFVEAVSVLSDTIPELKNIVFCTRLHQNQMTIFDCPDCTVDPFMIEYAQGFYLEEPAPKKPKRASKKQNISNLVTLC